MSISKVKTVMVSVEIPEENAQLLATLVASWNGKVCLANLQSEPVVETKETLVSTKASGKVKAVSKFFTEKLYKSGNAQYFLNESIKQIDDINKLMSSKSEGWCYKKDAYAIICAEEFKELFAKQVDFEDLAKLDEITRNEQAYKVLTDFVKKDKKSLWFKTNGYSGLLLSGRVVSLKETTYKVPNAKNAKKSTTIRFNKVETLKLF